MVVMGNVVLRDVFFGGFAECSAGWSFFAGVTESVHEFCFLVGVVGWWERSALRKLRGASLASKPIQVFQNDTIAPEGGVFGAYWFVGSDLILFRNIFFRWRVFMA